MKLFLRIAALVCTGIFLYRLSVSGDKPFGAWTFSNDVAPLLGWGYAAIGLVWNSKTEK